MLWQVREETGLDISGMLVEEDCIERHIKQQRSKLYIITGVGASTYFIICTTLIRTGAC